MEIYFIEHAEERFIERNISIEKIKEMLKKGAIIDDIFQKFRRKICIYKEGNQYYSIIFQPFKEHKFIITGYPSKEWEKRIFERMKK